MTRARIVASLGASLVASSLVLLSSTSARAADKLASMHGDPSKVTVAGISSGGFMAVQLDVAYSSVFHGAAIFAGGPYDCTEGNISNGTGRCASGSGIPLTNLYAFTDDHASKGDIDPTAGIGNEPIYLFSGTLDNVVHPPVMDALQQYFGHYTAAKNIDYDNATAAGHAWISPDGPNACSATTSPFVNACGKDVEQTFLTEFYGTLAAKAASPTGTLVQFDQTEFCDGGDCTSISMDDTGWAYVPASCAAGTACKVLVAIHGCSQYQGAIGKAFIQDAGLDGWADSNDLVVLYPQTTPIGSNPLGCWDFWGYTGNDFALKSAPQMRAIVGMVDRVLGIAGPAGPDGGVSSGGDGGAHGGGASGDGGGASDGGAGGGSGSSGCGCRTTSTRAGDADFGIALIAASIAVAARRKRR